MSGLGDFEKLPPEIRAEIWKLALIGNDHIYIDRLKNESPWRKWSDEYTLSHGRSRLPHELRDVVFPRVQLIRASKALNIEAGPILYHENHFVFDDPNVLETFFDKIGEMAFSLSEVEIRDMYTQNDASKLSALRRMHDPKRIVLAIPRTSERADAGKAARDTWNMIKNIVVRTGSGYLMTKSLRPYAYEQVLADGTPCFEYRPGTEEQQRKRLEAFHFTSNHFARKAGALFDPRLPPPRRDGVTYKERAERFRKMVFEHWEKNVRWSKELQEKGGAEEGP